jgi:hypothetical protein
MGVKRLILLVALFAVLAVALTAAYLQRDVPATQATWPALPYQSEDEWIVSRTAVAVIDLAQFAKTSVPEPIATLAISQMHTDPAQPIVRFRVGSRDVTVNLTTPNTYVWDPDAYLDLARSAGVAPAQTSDTSAGDDVATALLGFRVENFRVQSDAVSIALQKDYRNPANHEAAALLLGAFAFREAARHFYDPRWALCRASAHLAVARAMRDGGTPSPAGQLADIVLQIVAGRTGPALRQLDAFDQADHPSAFQSWSQALRRRATFDWREAPDDDSPLLERVEYVRSLARMLGTSDSLSYLSEHEPEEVPDWGWLMLDALTTVESGHVFVESTIGQTQIEVAQVLGISPNTPPETVDALLSREPNVSSIDRTEARGIRVLDEGMWSAFYRRELAHVADQGYQFYRYMLGDSQGAGEFERQIARFLGRQPVWPVVQRLILNTDLASMAGTDAATRGEVAASYRASTEAIETVFQTRPDAMSYIAWRSVGAVPSGMTPVNVPQASLWFRTLYPTGTAFESRRVTVTKILPNDFVVHADAMHELAPWDPNITINWSIVRCSHNGGCTPEQERANFALIATYSVDALQRFAARSPSPETDLKRLCQLSGEDCVRLAEWFLTQDRFPEAAAAYQESFDRNLDRVSASHGVEWVVRYYQKTGRTREARRIAEGAGVVGSFAGMKALAGFLERQSNFNDAERVYRRMSERYEDGTRLLAFYMRRADATRVPPTASEYRALLDRYFGGDVEHVTTTALTGQPSKGLFVRQTTPWDDRFGIKKGDVIVAVDGIHVWTRQQEQIIYARSFDDTLRYTVWREGRYMDVSGPFRRYLQGPQYLDEFPRQRPPVSASSH